MKNLLFLFLLFLFVGCENIDNNRLVGQNVVMVYFPSSSNVYIQTVELDKHKYYVTSHESSLTHSEACPCKQKAEK